MRKQQEQSVADTVRRYLQGRDLDGVTLDVEEQGIYKDQYRWYVPVRPSVEPQRRYQFYEVLTDIEEELEDREHLKVLLVPADPIDAPAA
jgi:hypothetical protein